MTDYLSQIGIKKVEQNMRELREQRESKGQAMTDKREPQEWLSVKTSKEIGDGYQICPTDQDLTWVSYIEAWHRVDKLQAENRINKLAADNGNRKNHELLERNKSLTDANAMLRAKNERLKNQIERWSDEISCPNSN